jgi:TRAP-type C4-dicarboxylate transport system permease small subunit
MRTFNAILEHAVAAVAATLLATFTVIILIDVVCRYLLHIAVPWATELTVLLFQWTIFLGSPLALRRGLHFGLGLVVPKYWPRSDRWMRGLVATVVLGASGLLFVLGIEMTQRTWHSTYPTLPLSHGVVNVGIAVSAFLMILFGLEQLYLVFKRAPEESKT